MRTVFLGASRLGYECCRALLASGKEIAHIFTLPETFSIKYAGEDRRAVKNALHADLRELGVEFGVPVTEVNGKLGGHEAAFKALAPDFILAIGWYHMIPSPILKLPPKGTAGIHASLLPKYRGNAPLVWAMIEGERETGVSFFYFSEGVDEGDLIGQKAFPIEREDTIAEVLAKATEASIELLLETYDAIARGTLESVPQDHTMATVYPPRKPEDGEIDWAWPAERIRNFIRAQTRPYPGAFAIIEGKKVTIWDASVEETREGGTPPKPEPS